MKNFKLPILSLSVALVVASCQKDDFREDAATDLTTTTATALNASDTIGWKSTTQWDVADQETFSVRYFTIEDPAITADVADNGLVLLFKRNGAAINALPFEEGAATGEEESASDNYWYHQVTEGSLLISCDVFGNKAVPGAANSFKYFVITPEKLQSLETDGYNAEKLMGLSYTEAATLFSNAQ
jgi:hypothetical protein